MAPAPRAEAGGSSPTPSTDTANVNASLVDAMEEVNMKTDEATPTANTDEDTSNEEYNPDNLSASTIKHRAKSHWNFIKSLHIAQKEQHSQRQLFKMGENTSMTTSEATFLNMIAKQRLSVDHDYHTKSAEDEDAATAAPTTDPLAVSGRTHFSHLVQAAVAKERLRDAISARLSDLSGAEAKFLTKLVENKSVSLEALENAVHVLDNDPLYNEKLRMEQSFVMSFTAGGLSEEMIAMLEEEDSEEEGEGDSNGDLKDEKKDVVKPMNIRQSTRMQRQSSAIQCSALFEKSLSEKALRERRNSENHEMIASTNGRRRKIGRRGSSTMELGLWNLSKGVADGEESIGLDESSRSRLRKASVVEKSMWQIVHGESIEHVDSDMQHSLDELEDEDGLPTKAINKGDAMDPLLMAVPVERSPYMPVKKTLEEEEKAKPAATQVRLAELLADHQARKEKLNQGESSSFVNDDIQEMSSQLLACCGVDPNSFLTDIYGANYDAETTVEGNTNEDKRVGEKDSLASKKEYLHLKEEEKTDIDRHAHLSTWLGTPEDYPILGLKKTVTADETSLLDDIIHEESESSDGLSDPLEPHVLSPLLMKCLREHLPYALREENFWLKYSLVRDVSESLLVVLYSLFEPGAFVLCKYAYLYVHQSCFLREHHSNAYSLLCAIPNIPSSPSRHVMAKYLDPLHRAHGEIMATNTMDRAKHSRGCYERVVLLPMAKILVAHSTNIY